LGTYFAPKSIENLRDIISFEKIKEKLRQKTKLPLVLVTAYEHHSNEITWRNQLCDVIEVSLNDSGLMDYIKLDQMIRKFSQYY